MYEVGPVEWVKTWDKLKWWKEKQKLGPVKGNSTVGTNWMGWKNSFGTSWLGERKSQRVGPAKKWTFGGNKMGILKNII